MVIALRGHQDHSKYHPDVGQPPGHGGLDNFVELVNLTIRQRNTSLEEHIWWSIRYIKQRAIVFLSEIWEDFLKFVHCNSGLSGKDLFKEVVGTLNGLGLDIETVKDKVMIVLGQ